MIVIADYGMGNLLSVAKAFQFLGFPVAVTQDPKAVAAAERLVLPGVGAFGDAMKELDRTGMSDAVRGFIATGRPFLGICLGEQLLLESSEESPGVRGLGIFKGTNVLFRGDAFTGPQRLKVPQIGWNKLTVTQPQCPVLSVVPEGSFFYFVHSYYAQPVDTNVIAATCDYGVPATAVLWRDNVVATQFHPEKSQRVGLALLKRFCAL